MNNTSQDDLRQPTPEKMQLLGDVFVETMMGMNKEDCKNPPFGALDVFPFPELHENGIVEVNITRFEHQI